MKAGRENQKNASTLQAMRAILWGFFGVRSKNEYQTDIAHLSMTKIIVFGIFGAVMFVMSLLLLVYFVTR